jgi:hypothetical protein
MVSIVHLEKGLLRPAGKLIRILNKLWVLLLLLRLELVIVVPDPGYDMAEFCGLLWRVISALGYLDLFVKAMSSFNAKHFLLSLNCHVVWFTLFSQKVGQWFELALLCLKLKLVTITLICLQAPNSSLTTSHWSHFFYVLRGSLTRGNVV